MYALYMHMPVLGRSTADLGETCSCVCDVGLGVSCIMVGVGREGGYCRMSSKCDRDMRESTVGMLSIRETPWSA